LHQFCFGCDSNPRKDTYMRIIYADNNATTQVAPEVTEAMAPFFTEKYFNPSSMYEPARYTAQAMGQARADIARHLGLTDPKQILFTGCATESNNTAIFGTAKANPNRRHIITTAVEHPAVLQVCQELIRNDYKVTFLGVDSDGNLDIREFVRALSADTLLVTIMHANNETGVIFPIEQLSRLTKETDPAIVFHTDATQSVGKIPIDLRQDFPHVDMLSFSGHKLHAPKGIGVLYIKRGTPCRPLLIGGHQEEGRRAGTENVPYIVGLAKALQMAAENYQDEDTRVRGLRDRLEKELEQRIPNVQVNGKTAPRTPNTLNISCHYVEGEGMLYQLMDDFGICASSGSACTSGSLEPSHVLRAMNVPDTAVHGSVRFSFSRYNTDEDIDCIIAGFPGIVANLRRLSPYWDQEKDQPRPDAENLMRRH
jgi:cysteine desulfurase